MRRLFFCALLAASLPAAAKAPAGCHPRAQKGTQALTAPAADRLRRAPGTTRGARPGEFLVSDGRVMVQDEPGQDGALYTTDAFKQRRRELDEELRFRRVGAGQPFHLLRSLIDDGATFGAGAPQRVADLRRRLATEDPGLPAALPIEQLAAGWREAGCRLDAALFRELTAWAGEQAMKRASAGARWITRPGDGGVVEPVVEVTVGGETRQLAPWLWVSQLLEPGPLDPVGLAAWIDEALLPARPKSPPVTAADRASEADAAVALPADGSAIGAAPPDAGPGGPLDGAPASPLGSLR
ncbi:MAG: hypothetical protein EXR72_15300 [Myxococcales bacterium]|nr:hypothetical protein [Myxococcales bacterium]